MLETCLKNKLIKDFLNNYEESRWKKLIPSLIEIAILNLKSSFNTVIYSEEDIKNIIDELKLSQNSNNIQTKKPKREAHSHIIFSKPSNQWRTADGGVPPISGNREKEFYFDNSSLTNKSNYNKDNRDIFKENIMIKKTIKNTRSKIKDQVENDRRNYFNKINGNNPNYLNNINNNKNLDQINYAISYDKNLEPELIEKTTFNRNKKGGKKIIEKMTQEEYEQKFPDEEQNIENEYEEEEDEDNNEKNYEENDEEVYYEAPGENINNNYNNIQPYNNIQRNNNQVVDRKNLYHYNINNNNKNNNIRDNNLIQGNNQYNKNQEFIQNPQQSFNPKNFKNNAQQNINQGKNNYINIENNSNEPQNMNNDYNYNPNRSEQFNNNYKIGNSESEDKSSKFIGIEQKYQKKIDELEKNIINSGANNASNYGDKLQVNITNMEDYAKKNINSKEYQNYQSNNMNNNEEEGENEENNLSDMDMNEIDGGVLSQMSNMSERTKSLFKRTMDEYPPLEEDTFYEQSQNK